MRSALLVILLCSSAGVLAEAYKCKQDGRTVYTPYPCGVDAVVVDSRLTGAVVEPESSFSAKRTGPSSLVLSLDGALGYRVDGTVKGVPVLFHVDTGASHTSISSKLAMQAGIYGCDRRGFSRTANGTVPVCNVRVPQITFGNFQVNNIEVTVMPNLDSSLLGMNVLRYFKVEQQPGGLLRISIPAEQLTISR